MGAVQSLIVLSWLVIIVFGIGFNIAIGRPSRSLDPPMTKHVIATTSVSVMEVIALVLAGRTLLIAAVIYPISAAVMVWRFALLVQTRRSARERAKRHSQSPMGD